MLNWMVTRHVNNQASQALQCNARLTFERYIGEKTDEFGYLTEDAHWEKICEDLPCGFTPYQGRPDYETKTNSAGVVADSLYAGQVQLNDKTRKLKINDEFTYGDLRYRIINIDWSETNIDQTRGL